MYKMAAAQPADVAGLRCRLASAVAYAARRKWRLPTLSPQDEVVLDILCEALARLGMMVQPKARKSVAESFCEAPARVQQLVSKLETLAIRPSPGAEAHAAAAVVEVDGRKAAACG